MQLPTIAVRTNRHGSVSVRNDSGQTIILNGVVQPGISERDAQIAAELLTPITFPSPAETRD